MASGDVWLVAIGAVLVLFSYAADVFDHAIANASFWIGLVFLIIGVFLIVIRALSQNGYD